MTEHAEVTVGAQGCNAQSSWKGNYEIKYCARPVGHPGEHRSSLVSEWDTLKWRDDDDPVPASQSVPAVPVSSTGGKETGGGDEAAQGVAEPDYVTVPVTPQYLATRAIANIIDEHFGDDYEEAAWAAAEEIVRQGYAYPRLSSPLSREELGQRVADVCVQWSREDDERDGASATWDALNSHRRELYMRVGEALFGLGMTWSPAPAPPLGSDLLISERIRAVLSDPMLDEALMLDQVNAIVEGSPLTDSETESCPDGECNQGMCGGVSDSSGPCGGCCGCLGGCLDAGSPALSGEDLRDVEERDDASEETQ